MKQLLRNGAFVLLACCAGLLAPQASAVARVTRVTASASETSRDAVKVLAGNEAFEPAP